MGLGALANQNSANVNMQGNVNAANAGNAQTTMKGQQDMIGGLLQGAGTAATMAAHGGYIAMADGGDPMAPYAAPQGNGPLLTPQAQPAALPGPVTQPPPGPQSSFGQFLMGGSTKDYLASQPTTQDTSAGTTNQMFQSGGADSSLKKGASTASKAATMALMAASGGKIQHDFRGGGHVTATSPAEKAVAPGDNYANDKVKALLSEGEVVLPRSVMNSKDPVSASADFVRKVLAKRKAKPA
jgi:hypothetical protein